MSGKQRTGVTRRSLKLPKLQPISESDYIRRRTFLAEIRLGAMAGAAGVSALTLTQGAARAQSQPRFSGLFPPELTQPGVVRPAVLRKFPAGRSARYALPGGVTELTDAEIAFSFNNFYEFTQDKELVWRLAEKFTVDPWTVEVGGACHKPRKFDLDDLFKFEQEERTYRFRCVEAWAMDVPWTGFALSRLLEAVEPKASAKFVRFQTVLRPDQMPGQKNDRATRHYPWPYFEGLRMDEAMNELTLGCTGLFGQPLTRQNGAPFRIIVPWKYGYKSPKSIVRIELTAEQPATFWETLQPAEYPFESNVNPAVPHPRWSQALERVIPGRDRRPTLLYNGYAEYVAPLYG